MAISGFLRYCLDLQGYSRLSDEAKRQIGLAQRFKPLVCTILVGVCFVTQSVPLTVLAAVLGYWAAFFPNHPADVLYRSTLQRRFGAPDLGADPAPRRFACGFAATLLLVGAIAWAVGAATVGSLFVGMVVLALLTLVLSGFCVGSLFFWLLVRRQVFRGVR